MVAPTVGRRGGRHLGLHPSGRFGGATCLFLGDQLAELRFGVGTRLGVLVGETFGRGLRGEELVGELFGLLALRREIVTLGFEIGDERIELVGGRIAGDL